MLNSKFYLQFQINHLIFKLKYTLCMSFPYAIKNEKTSFYTKASKT